MMAGAFDLRKVLKSISPPLRAEFLGRFRELRTLPLDTLKQTEVDPIVAGLQTMKPPKRREIQVLFQRMVNLERNPGQKVLLEELQHRYPARVTEWAGMSRRIDKVMWMYLNARDAFEEAAIFARADALSGKRCWNRWSGSGGNGFVVTPDRIDALAQRQLDLPFELSPRNRLTIDRCHEIALRRRLDLAGRGLGRFRQLPGDRLAVGRLSRFPRLPKHRLALRGVGRFGRLPKNGVALRRRLGRGIELPDCVEPEHEA